MKKSNSTTRVMVQKSDKTAQFVSLMGAHDRRLFGYILSQVPNFADAEELAQQVRLRLWEQFDHYDVEKDFGVWARTIARYFIMAHYKKSSTTKVTFQTTTVESIAEKAVSCMALHEDRMLAMQECLGKLDDSKRRLLVHYYSTSKTMREISEEIGRSLMRFVTRY